ncbi:hypothetical protein GGR32_000325 [Mesonia hippocampi]|uniref:Uncharacterized protein n=1 Tax=Mesonia hippocampi TaxID=1628250 RepID=A0A840EN49_9FLAO|nr:hypothetical protein [Mesonia hippocampi]MBB4118053.1 hypothetical protein [Mesonia hippocampi]
MELQQIKTIIERYFEGNTSLAEEKQLSAYFSQENVHPDLKHYQPLFSFFNKEKQQEYNEPLPKITSKTKTSYYVFLAAGIAASFLLVFSVFLWQNKHAQKPIPSAENKALAMQNTQELLKMMTDVIGEGKEQLRYIEKIQETKNKIIKTKQ